MKWIVFFIQCFLCFLLVACSDPIKTKKENLKTYTVKEESLHKTLYFTGTIQPIHESALSSPVEATIESMHYHFGQQIKKNEVVFTLDSAELQRQYNESLTDYLKSKDNFTIAKARFNGTNGLWKAGLISKNNYLSEKSSLDTARMTFLQSTKKLSDMLEKMNEGSSSNFSNLSIAQFEEVNKALSTNHHLIRLKAPSDGILLYPPKSGDDKSGKLNVGTSIKTGQVLALVGDLSGVSVEIDIPEVDIDKIHVGMPAIITGVAMGNRSLTGEVVAVNAQANNSSNGLPSFSAIIEVRNLTKDFRDLLKVGMSASISIPIDSKNKLMVPIEALKQIKGETIVHVKKKDGSLQSQSVTTGEAQADKVVIASGLTLGDVIAYN